MSREISFDLDSNHESTTRGLWYLKSKRYQHPCSPLPQEQDMKRQTFYNISTNEYIARNIPEFYNKGVLPASYGCLLLIDFNTRDCSLVMNNIAAPAPPPQDKLFRVSLPQLPIEPNSIFIQVALSKPPTDPDCRVLIVSDARLFLFPSHIIHYRLGDLEFHTKKNKFGDGQLQLVANVKDKIYGLMGDNTFVSIDFVGQEVVFRPLMDNKGHPCHVPRPPPSDAPAYFSHPFMVESCGELLLVHLVGLQYAVQPWCFRIFRVDIIEGKCEELKSIGDRTIFLSFQGIMSLRCCAAKDDGSRSCDMKKNSIYYSWSDGNIWVYDIEDRSNTLLKMCSTENGIDRRCDQKIWI